jgi:hypothetical protein
MTLLPSIESRSAVRASAIHEHRRHAIANDIDAVLERVRVQTVPSGAVARSLRNFASVFVREDLRRRRYRWHDFVDVGDEQRPERACLSGVEAV